MKNPGRAGIAAIAFFTGLEAAIVQVVLIRELLTVCRGNELIIGIIFSSWFFGIFLGARLNPAGGIGSLKRRALVSMALLPCLMAAAVYGAHALQAIVPRVAGTFYSFSAEAVIALVCAAPAGFFVGFFFPPLVALASMEMGRRSAGFVYYLESLGSFAGGIAFSFLLVEAANPLELASGLLCGALVIIGCLTDRRLLPLVLVPLTCVFFSGRIETRVFSAVWDRTHAGTLESYRRTRYQAVAVESAGDTVSVYGNGVLVHTLPDRYESRGIVHLINALRGNRKTLLLIGSGPGALLNNMLRADIERLTYIEQDPGLWEEISPWMKRFYPGADTSKLSLQREDPRHFLTRTAGRFDMIISMPPAPENIMLNRFYTREFYALCKKRLDRRGVFITSLHGFSNYLSPELRDFIASVYRAFAGEFSFRLVTSGETMYLIGAAEEGVLPASGEELIARYNAIDAHPLPFDQEIVRNFSPRELRCFFEKTQIGYFKEAMARAGGDENRDMRPGAYWKNIVLSAFRERSVLYDIIRGFLVLPVLVLLAAAAAIGDIGRRYGGRRMAAGAVICATGMASMSAMMIMIILYQNAHGIVYHRISLINAIFMLGLTAGSFFSSRGRTPRPALIVGGAAVSVASMLVLTLPGTGFLFWPLLAVFSFLCGALFPSLFAAIGRDRYQESASVLDAMDHFGSITGSLLTVMLFLPVLGIQGALAAVSVILIPAAVIAWKVIGSDAG
ncbi:MAG: hypothetical protein JXA07_11365 [Spirochaetes bacterium]|nr:hypothetical protein [Spirochaetota bacterium]